MNYADTRLSRTDEAPASPLDLDAFAAYCADDEILQAALARIDGYDEDASMGLPELIAACRERDMRTYHLEQLFVEDGRNGH